MTRGSDKEAMTVIKVVEKSIARNGTVSNKVLAKKYQKARGQVGLAEELNAEMVCPHCQVQGKVTTKAVKTKKGISGGKATGAVLTAGFSLLATGLSRKEHGTEAHCANCGTTWTI